MSSFPILLTTILGAGDGEVGVVGDLVIVLSAAGLTALLMRRLGLAAIPAFLLAGMALGPHTLGLVPAPEQLGPIAHVAIIVLLFGIGLELHLSSLRGGLVQLIGAGLTACGVCVAGGWVLGRALGLDAPHALLVAMALSLSSTAVVLKHLTTRRELGHPSGRLAVAILVVQDLAVVAMLALLPAIARSAGVELESGSAFGSVAEVLLRIGAVAVLMIASRWIMGPLLSETLRAGVPELLLLVGLAYALGAAWATQALGFSLEMGAFLAGFVLSGSRFRHQLAGQVVPIRDFFLAVFFTTLGMQLDPRVVVSGWSTVLGATLLLVVTKSALISLSCWVFGVHASVSALVGLTLAQAGEFSLVLIGAATAIGLLDADSSALLIAVVVLSLILTPSLAALGRHVAGRLVELPLVPWGRGALLRRPVGQDAPDGLTGPEVIIAGFGPVGRRVATDLEEEEISYLVLDLNPGTIAELELEGRPAALGDVRNEAVLAEAGIREARAIVLAIPDHEAAVGGCVLVRRMAPDVLITVRAGFERNTEALRAAGADHVVVDELAAADRMAEAVVDLLRTDAPA